jgi:hypothetical protein
MGTATTSPAAGGSLRGAGVHLIAVDVYQELRTGARARVSAPPSLARLDGRRTDLPGDPP